MNYIVEAPDGTRHIIQGPDAPQATPDDPGIAKSVELGFGRASDKFLQGLKQAGLGIAGVLSEALPQSLKDPAQAALANQLQAQQDTQSFRDSAYTPLQQQHPIATMAGEAAPFVALPMARTLTGATVAGALPGLLSYGDTKERAVSGGAGAVGGGAGYGVGKVIGNVVSPAMQAADPEVARLAQVAAQNKVPLDVAQITQNPVLQNAKAALDSIPWTANAQAASKAAQQQAFNKAVLGFSGGNATSATPDVMGDIYKNIIQKKIDAATGVSLSLDEPALTKLADVESSNLRRLPTDQKQLISSYVDDILNSANNPISGDVYAKTRSTLGQIANSTENNNLREGAKGLQGVLDDMFDRTASPDQVQQMQQFRDQYSKYMTTTGALQRARSGSDIPAKPLYAQAQQDIPGFERNTGDFANLVRAGRQFLPDPVANSGTVPRQIYTQLLSAGSLPITSLLGGGAQYALLPDAGGERHVTGGALAGLGLGMLTSKGASAALRSPLMAKYLQSALLNDAQKLALARTGGLLGYAAAPVGAPIAGSLAGSLSGLLQ